MLLPSEAGQCCSACACTRLKQRPSGSRVRTIPTKLGQVRFSISAFLCKHSFCQPVAQLHARQAAACLPTFCGQFQDEACRGRLIPFHRTTGWRITSKRDENSHSARAVSLGQEKSGAAQRSIHLTVHSLPHFHPTKPQGTHTLSCTGMHRYMCRWLYPKCTERQAVSHATLLLNAIYRIIIIATTTCSGTRG